MRGPARPLSGERSVSSVGFGFRRFLGRRRVRGVMDRGYRSSVAEEESKVADRDAIVRVALDYFEGWFDGDAARMERTLHADLAKRSPDDAPTPGELEKLTAREMIEATAKGIGKTRDVPDRGIESSRARASRDRERDRPFRRQRRIPAPTAYARRMEDRQRPLAAPLTRKTAARFRSVTPQAPTAARAP